MRLNRPYGYHKRERWGWPLPQVTGLNQRSSWDHGRSHYQNLSAQLSPTFKVMVRKLQDLEGLGGWRKSRGRVLKLGENVLGRKKEAVSTKYNREITWVTCDWVAQRGVGLGEGHLAPQIGLKPQGQGEGWTKGSQFNVTCLILEAKRRKCWRWSSNGMPGRVTSGQILGGTRRQAALCQALGAQWSRETTSALVELVDDGRRQDRKAGSGVLCWQLENHRGVCVTLNGSKESIRAGKGKI